MRILITGAGGYIGSSLMKTFRRKYSTIAVDNLLYGQGPAVYDSLQCADITEIQTITGGKSDESWLKELVEMADVVIPLAAIVGAPACDKNAELAKAINYDSIEQIVSWLRPDQLIMYPNTNSGYGKCDKLCTEETPLNPISYYGKLKDNAENVVRTHPNHIVYRLATVFGVSPRHRMDLLVNTLTYEAATMNKVTIFEDSFMRNYIHVQDICGAFAFGIKNRRKMAGNVYNLGNDSINMSKGDLATKIVEHTGCALEKINRVDPDQRYYEVSSAKLYEAGFECMYNLDFGIDELVAYYKMFPVSPPSYMTNV